MIVGVAGQIAAGKTTTAQLLQDRFGFTYLSYSLFLKQLLLRQGQPVRDVDLQAYGQRVFEDLGGFGLTHLMMQTYDPSKNYVIEGLRHVTNKEYFKRRFDDQFYLIYVEAADDVRKMRYMERGPERDHSLESFYERSAHPMEGEVPLLKRKASAIVVNSGLTDLTLQVDALIQRWGIKHHGLSSAGSLLRERLAVWSRQPRDASRPLTASRSRLNSARYVYDQGERP